MSSGVGDRKVDTSGNVGFAGTTYPGASKFRRQQVEVAVVGDTHEISISIGNQLIRIRLAAEFPMDST